MRVTTIVGPVTGQTYPAIDTGETWNGAPVLGFASATLTRLVAAGDGADSNGEGLAVIDGRAVDLTNGEVQPVEVVRTRIGGQDVTLYVPGGRIWEEAESNPNSTIAGIGYDMLNRCRACGAHIADPHAPQCPAEVASRLREEADANDAAHAATLAAGGYTSGACPTTTEGDEPAEVSHSFVAIAQRLAADLIQMEHDQAIDLDLWPEAAEFVAYLTGEADQWGA